MADAPRKPRAPTSRWTWACAVILGVAAVAAGYGAYVTVGGGRTVDASGIRPGMTTTEVSGVLGDPAEYVESGNETAMRYGRTHVWCKSVPGRGGIVTDVTTGPR